MDLLSTDLPKSGVAKPLTAAAGSLAFCAALAITAAPANAQLLIYNYGYGYGYHPAHHRSPAKAKLKAAKAEHVNKEPFGQIPKGPLQIIISVDQQKLHLYSGGSEVAETLIATGVPAHPTPFGVFSVIQKSLLHHSNIYSGAPMPYMQRITWSGVALHEGVNLGHPASHGCIRMPHDFATRLWTVSRLGTRVVIARAELRPHDIADPHLFVHNTTTAGAPANAADANKAADANQDKPIKTAQTLADGQTDQTRVADAAAHTADDPAAAPQSDAARTDAQSDPPKAAADPAPDAKVVPASLPLPPAKPSEVARPTPKMPIAVFISRKTKKVYVRQDFSPLFDAPIAIDNPDQTLGTHVFTALDYLDDHTFRWNVISLPAEPPRQARAAAHEIRTVKGKRREVAVAAPPPPPTPSPQEALARIQIPADVTERISQLFVPGSSLIISDQGLGEETGEGTDFIVVSR